MQDTFLAKIAHETRTLISAIYACTDLLGHSLQGQTEALDLVRTIRDNGGHLLHLINNAMEMCKLNTGMMTARAVDCDPGQIVVDVVSLMQSKAVTKGLALSAKCDSPIPEMIRTDPMRLRQILINLLDNAIKFTHRGSVGVSIASVQDQGSCRIRLSVKDTGVGMTAQQLQRVFQPFAQADPITGVIYGGSGLGLSISQQLATLLGGELSVSSQPTHGSTFTLEIPVGQVPNIAMAKSLPQLYLGPVSDIEPAHFDQDYPTTLTSRAGRLDGMNVMLIEDRSDQQLLLSVILKSAGAKVTLASCAATATQLMAESIRSGRPYHGVLLEMRIRDDDSRAVVQQLRELGYRGPVVAVADNEDDRHDWVEDYRNDNLVVRRSKGDIVSDLIRALAEDSLKEDALK